MLLSPAQQEYPPKAGAFQFGGESILSGGASAAGVPQSKDAPLTLPPL